MEESVLDMSSFQKLVELLPRSERRPLQVPDSDSVRYVSARNPRFVAPEMEVIDDGREGANPSVLVISAPAAVGKTTLAGEIAYQTGSPIWDLSRFNVGNDFFVGTIASHFGYGNLASVMKSFEEGTGCVILDAVDEAQVRAGPRNFDAFLDDLARAHVAERPKPSLVLLARPFTAGLIGVALELRDVKFRHYGVSFFGEPAAKQLIDAYLDASGSSLHRSSRKPFKEFREALFDKVFAALGFDNQDWDSDRARRFVGYAPVLAAMASYLDVANYKVAANEVRAAAVSENLWAFLADLVKQVMQREHAKLLSSLRPKLEPIAARLGWSSWDLLYRDDEQCARVLSYGTDRSVDNTLPADIPTAILGEYEEAVGGALPNHPFCVARARFANVVFRDYVYAHALAGGRADLCAVVRENLSSETLPSALLGAFLLTLAPRASESALPVIDPLDVGALYDSMQSFARSTEAVSLDLALTEEAGIAVGIARFPVGDKLNQTKDFGFEIQTVGSPVRFGQQLSSAMVDLETDVELGYSGRLMTIGPDVFLSCGKLRMTAAAYRVQTNPQPGLVTEEAQVTFIAKEVHQQSIPELNVFGDGFSVQVEHVTHPWAPYRRSAGVASVPKERWDAFSRLRKILVHFRADGKADLARYADFVDNILVGSSATGQAVMKVLLKSGLLRRQGEMYVLSRRRLQELGISRNDLIASHMSAGIRDLLSQVDTAAH